MVSIKVKRMSFFIIFVLFIFCLSIGFGLLIRKFVKVPEKPVNENDVVLIADYDTVTMNNRFAVSDQFGANIKDTNGGTFIYYTFSLMNHSNEERNYEIYLTQEYTDQASINTKYLKFYLATPDNFGLNALSNDVIPTYDKLAYLVDKPSSKLLYSGKLQKRCSTDLVLRVWLAENYIPPVEESFATFEVHVRAV